MFESFVSIYCYLHIPHKGSYWKNLLEFLYILEILYRIFKGRLDQLLKNFEIEISEEYRTYVNVISYTSYRKTDIL